MCLWLLIFLVVDVAFFHKFVWVFHLFGLWKMVEGIKGVGIGAPSCTTLVRFFLCFPFVIRDMCKPILNFLLRFWFGWSIKREVPEEVPMFMEFLAS